MDTVREVDWSSYWDYWDDSYDWPDARFAPDAQLFRTMMVAAGLSPSAVQLLADSGFVMFKGFPDLVVDRFYGDALLSVDGRTRIQTQKFVDWLNAPGSSDLRSRCELISVSSRAQLDEELERLGGRTASRLLVRGQTSNHSLRRAVPNACLSVPGLGEVSLVPSVWRRMMSSGHSGYPEFQGLSVSEWLKVLHSQFDSDEIERRRNVAGLAEPMVDYWDLEDSSDPMLEALGRISLDAVMGAGWNLAVFLGTLLQHYGLLSPCLDLSDSIDVGLFFASQKFRKGPSICSYQHVGSTHQGSVLYIFREPRSESHRFERDRVLLKLDALRPVRQGCVVIPTNSLCLNMPADHLLAVVQLNFIPSPDSLPTAEHLFPNRDSDTFLSALLEGLEFPEHVTSF